MIIFIEQKNTLNETTFGIAEILLYNLKNSSPELVMQSRANLW